MAPAREPQERELDTVRRVAATPDGIPPALELAAARAPVLDGLGGARVGLPLIDGAAPGEPAAVCAELGRYSLLLTVAPPRIHGITGLLVDPGAIFTPRCRPCPCRSRQPPARASDP